MFNVFDEDLQTRLKTLTRNGRASTAEASKKLLAEVMKSYIRAGGGSHLVVCGPEDGAIETRGPWTRTDWSTGEWIRGAMPKALSAKCVAWLIERQLERLVNVLEG